MILLIVDDQKHVVDSLIKNVHWSDIDINETVGAYSAAEARNIIVEKKIDVILCDIEMPVENGLSLVEWVREYDMHIKCILLTAHAEFSYARKSVSLGAFDYILQPAPYSEIKNIVEKAIQDIYNERKQKYHKKYEDVTELQKNNEVATALAQYLKKGDNVLEIQSYSERDRFPSNSHQIHLVLLQILRWSSYDNWNDNLLTAMFSNAISEIFSPFSQETLVVSMEGDCFAFLIWSSEYELSQDSFIHQLRFLFNVCQQRLHCTVALYQKGPINVSEIEVAWKWLSNSQKENINMNTGVFDLRAVSKNSLYSYNIPRVSQWVKMLKSNPNNLVDEAQELLDLLNSRGELNNATLCNIYHDFLQVVRVVSGDGHTFWQKVLTDSYSYDIYRCGMKSEEQLISLIHLVVNFFYDKSDRNRKNIVELVTEYIDDHLDKEIHRDELASYIYLNPDYLNRKFKDKTGYTLKEYVINYKMNEATKMLKMTRLPVSVIAAKVGYTNFSHFSYSYKKIFGYSPLESRQMGINSISNSKSDT